MRVFLCLPRDYPSSKRVRHDQAALTNGGPPAMTAEMEERGLAWFEAEVNATPYHDTQNKRYYEQATDWNQAIDELKSKRSEVRKQERERP